MATNAPAPLKDVYALPIDRVSPHPENPRRVTDAHPSLPGIAQTMKEIGQLQPIVARALPAGGWVIIAGERRWRAARMAGLPTIEAKIVDVDDEIAFKMTVVENLQREDLHWLEEARGVESLVKRGWDVPTMAAQLGKSEAWIRLRAKLAAISPKWQKAVEDPKSPFHAWPAAMLELVARFPVTTQDEIIEEGDYDLADVKTVADLRDYLNRQYLRELTSAPWKLDDAQLVKKAGACSACPKRSSCQQLLFADAKGDRCLDSACWKAKHDAHLVAAVAAARENNPKALVIGEDWTAPAAIKKEVKSAYQYREVKPETKGAVPAVYVSGDKAGQTGYVVKQAGYSGSSSSSSPKPAKKKATPKDKLAAHLLERHRAEICAVVELLGGSNKDSYAWGKLKQPSHQVRRPPHHVLVALVATMGVEGQHSTWDWTPKALKQTRELTDEALDVVLWDRVRAGLVACLHHDRRADKAGERPRVIAELCGVDWKTIAKAARDATPLPKDLAALFDEDGRPLKGLTAKVKTPAKSKASAAAAKA